MNRNTTVVIMLLVVVVVAGGLYWYYSRDTAPPPPPVVEAPPFGGDADVSFAADIWNSLVTASMAGPNASVADVYPGGMPHGELLQTVTTAATIGGHEGTLIVKKNFVADEGETITATDVMADPDTYLDSVTVMFQREAGYDAAHENWFWAKYLPDGTLDATPEGMRLAGRVGNVEAKAGCLGCHVDAPGGDFVFTNE